MPIAKDVTLPNGAATSFHFLKRIEITFPAAEAMLQVQSFSSEEAFLSGAMPLWTSPIRMPLGEFAAPLEQAVEEWLVAQTDGMLQGGTVLLDQSGSLGAAKERKNAAIDAERERRELLPIDYAGAVFDADAIAMRNVSGWQVQIANGLALPEGFAWRDLANVDHPADEEFVNGLGAAITMRGTLLYQQAWALKADVTAATTREDVEAVVWPS